MNCRYCHSSSNIIKLGGLNEMKICGIFPASKDVDLPSVLMELVFCSNCHLIQLNETGIDISMQYGDNYGYRSGLNGHMVNHLNYLAINEKHIGDLNQDSIVLEIGANDGTHLRNFSSLGAELIAVDPTLKKWESFYDFEAKLINDFFPSHALVGYENRIDMIVSHACFYDLPDVKNFLKAIHLYLKPGGVWSFEQIYLPSMLVNNAFDSICDEHLEYYTLNFLKNALQENNLFIENISFNEVNGGSVWITARKGYSKAFDGAFNSLYEMEKVFLGNSNEALIENFTNFFERIDIIGKELKSLLESLREESKIYAVGASTKGNALIQHWDLGSNIDGCLEINPSKFNSFTPGSNIKILDEDTIDLTGAVLIILPWHFGESIVNRYKDKCKAIIVPLPTVKVYTFNNKDVNNNNT